MSSCTLVAVAGGATYTRFALALMESARRHFAPCQENSYLILEGVEGWPAGTATRYATLLDSFPDTDFVFMVDADCLFGDFVGPEILPETPGITAVAHPGYLGKVRFELPYENRPDSAAYMSQDEGDRYYAGGLIGGTAFDVKLLASGIEAILGTDAEFGLMPRFHDESCLNRLLWETPPVKTLDPSYMHPDSDDWYRATVWRGEDFPRRLARS